jgi:hypothetical protein
MELDDPIIFLEESNVLDTKDDVIVYEERYKSGENIILNKDQITNELVNLFLNKYKLGATHKIEAFNECFENYILSSPDTIEYMMHPVIKCRKYRCDPDKEEYYSQVQTMAAFVNQFENLCKSSDTYVNTSKALYNLHKPFTTETNQVVPLSYSMDAYRHFVLSGLGGLGDDLDGLDDDQNPEGLRYQEYRLVGPVKIDTGKRSETQNATAKGCPSGLHYNTSSNIITLYDGDKVDIIGYLNMPPETSPYEIQIFNADQYRKSLNQFKKGDKLRVFFNDYVFDRENKLITSINAIATGPNEIKFPKHLILNGTEFMITNALNSAFHVYLRGDNKGLLKYRNSYLKSRPLFLTEPVILTLSEKIYLDGHAFPFKVLRDKKYAQTLAYLASLNKVEQPILEAVKKTKRKPVFFLDYLDFEKNAFAIQVYKDPPVMTIDTELTRALYLQNKNDYGHIYALLLFKKRLVEKIRSFNKSAIEKRIAVLKQELSLVNKKSTSSDNDQKITIAKKYNNFEQLQNHNQGTRRIYFDKDIDPTKYHLLNTISSTLSDEEKRTALLSQLLKEKDPEFEADAIIKGKRPVRDGDYALFNNMLYVRKRIKDVMMWIKTMQMPFKKCDNPTLLDFEELNTAITLDPFDLLCKKLKDIKQDHMYELYTTELIKLQSILALADSNILESIDNTIVEHYKLFELYSEDLTELRIPSNIKIELKVKEKDNHGNIDLFDIDDVYNNPDFNDGHGTLYMAGVVATEKLQIENVDILRTFTDIMQLSLDTDIMMYILRQTKDKYPQSKIQELVNKKLVQDISKNPKLKDDLKYKSLITQFKRQVVKNHNKNVILHIGALLSIILKIKFPEYTVKKIVPKCNSVFSQADLTNYIACLLTYLGTPDDLQFDQFTKVSTQQLEKNLKEVINDILESNSELRNAYNEVVNVVVNVAKPTDWTAFMQLNLTFKPDFNFDKALQLSYINYVKNLNESAITTIKLTNTVKFYEEFKDKAGVNGLDADKNTYYPPSKIIKTAKTPFKDITKNFVAIHVEQPIEEDLNIIEKAFLALPLNPIKTYDYDEPSWWDDHLYKSLNELFNEIENIVNNVGIVKALIITMESNNAFLKEKLVNLRSTLFNFLKFKLRTILARIVNIGYGELPFNAKLLKDLIPDLNPFYMDDLVKNIGILAFIFVLTLKNIMSSQPAEFVSKLLHHIFKELNQYLVLNECDDRINSKMQELRELKKQALQAQYSQDDDMRKLQKVLLKMGDAKIVEKPKDTKDPNEYAGENPDENEVE